MQQKSPVSALLSAIARRLRIEQVFFEKLELENSAVADYITKLVIRLLLELLPTQERKHYQQIVLSGTEDELYTATIQLFEKYHQILLPHIEQQFSQLQSKTVKET